MNWKSYAAVSGATVVAGWLVSAPPSNVPSGVQAPRQPARSAPAADAASDIERQATRLAARLGAERAFAVPARDPFRFAPRRAAVAAAARVLATADAPPPPPVPVAAPAPAVSLSGIAEDQIEGRASRTVVLSTPSGVLLAREGEEILGSYRVGRIESDAVELVPLGDAAPRRLTLGSPKP
jgi:hypothetical protein